MGSMQIEVLILEKGEEEGNWRGGGGDRVVVKRSQMREYVNIEVVFYM